MTNDLISRAALLEEYEWLKTNTSAYNHAELDEHIQRIKKAPTIDAVPVIRCKDCAEYRPWLRGNICMRLGSYYGDTKPDDFCSYGRRKEEEE